MASQDEVSFPEDGLTTPSETESERVGVESHNMQSQESTNSHGMPPNEESTECPNRKVLAKFFGVGEDELDTPFSSSFKGKPHQGHDGEIDHHYSDGHSLHSSSTNSLTETRGKKHRRQTSPETGTGLWLKKKPSTFKRKGSPRTSSAKDIDQGSVPTGNFKRKNKTKRFAGLFETGLHLKKKHTAIQKDDSPRRSQNEEGLFKLYANFPESEYACRRVFVDKSSKAEDIVRDFLDLSPVSYESYNDFVLCDVIGWYHSKPKDATTKKDLQLARRTSVGWKEECCRMIGGKEKPLIVQSLWVPRKGCSRRFEIRRKNDAGENGANLTNFDLINGDLDLASSSSNGSPGIRRWNHSSDDGSFGTRDFEYSESSAQDKETPASTGMEVEKEATESSDESASGAGRRQPPKDCPYIICVQGYSVEKDMLYHVLNKETLIIGNHMKDMEEDIVTSDPDVQLHAPDILTQHCILTCHRVADLAVANFSFDNFVVSVEPCQGGKVTLNGCQLHQEVELRPGDLISFGNYYHFIFRDATSKYQTLFGIRWMGPGNREEDGIYSEYPQLAEEAKRYESDVDRWKMAYKVEHESEMMAFLSTMVRADEGDFGLASGHLSLMMIEFAAYTQGPEQARMTLLNIANNLLEVTETRAKEMVAAQDQSDTKPDMDALLPDLKVLLIALSNSLELLNCLRVKLPDYLPQSNTGSEDPPAGGNQEVLSILEEVVMYSFQQCVYYITKTLYESLPHILSANPFTDDEDSPEPTGVNEIITICQKTLDLLQGVSVHPDMISQMFAYLFFFMNAALFNVLLERAASGKYLKWSKGVQIRGNLDIVESWILENGMEEQMRFVQRISSAADLLATPKIQLVQASWSGLRKDYPSLNPAQLHQLLSKYGTSKTTTRPDGWDPVDDDTEDAKQKDTILESFEDHPPLRLPSEASQLDLYSFHNLPDFQQFLEDLHVKLPFIQVYQVHFTKDEASTVRKNSVGPQPQSANGASLVGSRKHKGDPPEKPSRANIPPAENDPELQVAEGAHTTTDHEKGKRSKSTHQDNQTDGRHSAPDVIPGYSLVDERLLGEDHASENISATIHSISSTGLNDRENGNAKAKSEEQILKVASEEETTALLDAYISRMSIGPFDSIPEEDNELSETEECPEDVRPGSILKEDAMSAGMRLSSQVATVASSESGASPGVEDVPFGILNESNVSENPKQGQSKHRGRLGTSKKRTLDKPRSLIDLSSTIDDVYVVDIATKDKQLGVEFSDGLKSSIGMPGVYIDGFDTDSAAFRCGGLQVGDRVLAVDGNSLVGLEYDDALSLITDRRSSYRILVARSVPTSDNGPRSPITAL